MNECSNCLINDKFPGVNFRGNSLCGKCVDFNSDKLRGLKIAQRNNLVLFNKIVSLYLHKKENKYDCLIGLSGGKDSSYLAWLMSKQYGLRVLAVTVDTGFISNASKVNIDLVTRRLGIKHLYINAEAIFKKVYKLAFKLGFFKKPQGLPCYFCSILIPQFMVNTALNMKIPLIMSGAYDPENPKLLKEIDDLKVSSVLSLLDIKIKYRREIFNSNDHYHKTSLPKIIYPLNAIGHTENIIIKTLSKEFGKNNINNFSSIKTICFVALATIYLFKEKFGFNPYLNDISKLIRWGIVSKDKYKEEVLKLEEGLYTNNVLREEIALVLKVCSK